LTPPLQMNFKDFDALNSTIDAVGKLKLVGIGVISDHGPYFSKDLLKTICPE